MDPGTVAFVRSALALKDAPRRGWVRAVSDRRVESVADHAWGVALLAVALAAERPHLDRARLLETAVVHDLAEAVVGDILPGEYESRTAKVDVERRALARLLAAAPPPLAARVLARFDEYAAGSTEEARLVRDLDKLEMALQADRYEAAGVPPAALAEFRASARGAVQDEGLRAALTRESPLGEG